MIEGWPFALPEFESGWVWLVGAGPGDPGLLTVLAVHALRSADVILYDALVDERLLEMTKPEAERVYAGKRGGKPSCKQIDITQRLTAFARQGKRVLRLKGGDPFVFGRGAEEALGLVAAGVPFRVVPGVSAGIGGLGYAGIPLTHRDINSAVTFITGHGARGDLPERLDWAALAKGSPVIVVYMALNLLGKIAERLMAEGRSGTEPVALVSKATTQEQDVLETTLAECAEAAEVAALQAPVLVVIGEVVRLRSGLDWRGAEEAGRLLNPDPLGTGDEAQTVAAQ